MSTYQQCNSDTHHERQSSVLTHETRSVNKFFLRIPPTYRSDDRLGPVERLRVSNENELEPR